MASVGRSIIKETCLFSSLSTPVVGHKNGKMKDKKPQNSKQTYFFKIILIPRFELR